MPNDTPKPDSRSQADKDKSRQQSRPISGRDATGKGAQGRGTPAKGAPAKGGTAKGGGPPAKGGSSGPKAGGSGGGQRAPWANRAPTPAPAPRRSTAALATWGIVGLVVVIVAVLVIVKVTSGAQKNASGTINHFEPIPASLQTELTSVPASVFNTVGISSSATPVSPPLVVSGQKPFTFTGNGKALPGFYYYGAEYCPYCAAERWAIILSLSRFGQLSNLGYMKSSSTDVFPSTNTYTFEKYSYTSKYIAAHLDEYLSNQVDSSTNEYTVLKPPTAFEANLVKTYDSSTYFGGTSSNYPAFPFVDMGNKVLQLSASYTPSLLGGDSWTDIASGLDDPTNPVTQAIVATSNYLTAGICSSDGQSPASVCTSKGVKAADKALKLSA